MYDNYTVDVIATPMLPFNTTVVAQYRPELQTSQTGRGFEGKVLCRASDHHRSVEILNTKTNRILYRCTYKVIGDNPLKVSYSIPLLLLR